MNVDFDFAQLFYTQLWQLTLLILVVGAVGIWCCRKHPHLAYVLWLVVLAKALTPPLWASNLSLFGQVGNPPLLAWLAGEQPHVGESKRMPIVSTRAVQRQFSTGGQQAKSMQNATEETTTILPMDSRQGIWFRGYAAMGIWLAGAITLATLSAVVVFLRSRMLRATQMPVDPMLEASTDEIAKRLKIWRPVHLVVTSSGLGPAMCGVWRPTIILPQCVVENKSPADWEPILTHELVHLRRGDHVVTMLQWMVQIAWWFHPLVWWANRRIGVARERCCDHESVRELESPPSRYARCLLEVLEAKEHLRPVYGFPGFRPMDITARRVKEIMNMTGPIYSRTSIGCWSVALLAAIVVLPGIHLSSDGSAGADEPTQAADGAEENSQTLDVQRKLTERKKLVLKYGDGRPDGKKSIAGAGEMIQFVLPGEEGRIRAVRVHGSRYGYPQAPKENFEVTLLSEDMTEILHTELVPYSLFKRAKKGRWTYIPFKNPVEAPKTFWLVLNFNAERTKGVYVSYDTSTKGEFSRVGFNEEDARETDFDGDWMVQVLLAK